MRRPFSFLAALGTVAHHGYELRAGVGIVFEPFIGRRGALAYWSAALSAYMASAARGGPAFDKLLAFSNGTALAGGLVHFTAWPWEIRNGVPTLLEAEGLTEAQLVGYNRVLRSWVAASALALLLETPRRARPFALLGLAQALPLRKSAEHHFAWAREQARLHPEDWSPALLDDPVPTTL